MQIGKLSAILKAALGHVTTSTNLAGGSAIGLSLPGSVTAQVGVAPQRATMMHRSVGLSGGNNSALADTWTSKIALEAEFDEVRLWLPNVRTDSAISYSAIALASTENVQSGVGGAGEWQPQISGAAVTTLDSATDVTGWFSAPIVKTSGNYAITITGASKAASCVLSTADTKTAAIGDQVTIAGIAGMTDLNGNTYRVIAVSAGASITIDVNSAAFGTYTSGGTATSYAERSGSVAAAANAVRPAWGVTGWVPVSSADGAEGSTRLPSTAYALGARINDGTYAYEATTAGTSGSGAVALPSTIGGTVTDGGTLVWRNMGPKHLRYLLVRVKTVTQTSYWNTESTRVNSLTDTVNRGRIHSTARATGVDYATTPSSGTTFATGVNGPYVSFVVEYRSRKRGITVMYVGDSRGAYAYGHPTDAAPSPGSSDYVFSPGMRAAAIASTENLPVDCVNVSFAQKSSQQYFQVAIDALAAGMRPNVFVVEPWSPNNPVTNAALAKLSASKELARLAEFCDLARTYGAVVVANTPTPHQGTAVGVDAVRQSIAAKLATMASSGRLILADMRTAVTTPASLGTSQEQWTPALTWDQVMHPSEAGVEVQANVLGTVLKDNAGIF